MNFPRPLSDGVFVRLVLLFLFLGLAARAQQPDAGSPHSEMPRAGINGASMPKCIHCPDPEYSKEAKKKKYEGVVVLSVVVTVDGKATNIAVVKSPGMGLDDKAIEAVRNWKFKPAMKDGKPVKRASANRDHVPSF